jgi:hypothetical protein
MGSMKSVVISGCTLFVLFWLTVSCVYAQQTQKVNPKFLSILQKDAAYSNRKAEFPAFQYQSSNDDPALPEMRQRLKLDSIGGFGNEVSRLINIMHWVHNAIRHDGTTETGITVMNANNILETVKKKRIGIACGELATVLNDCYLAMGWTARKVYCFPKDSLKNDPDSHVINIVYAASLKKWLWMDPTNDAYVMNEKGHLLSIEEVRLALIKGKPLLVNPDANWNRQTSAIKEIYLYEYMAKNLYHLYSPVSNAFDYETKDSGKVISYIHLIPAVNFSKMTDKYQRKNRPNGAVTEHYYTDNPALFWALPKDE